MNEFLLLLLIFVVGGLGLAFWLDRRITQADASRREEFLRDVATSRPKSFILSYRSWAFHGYNTTERALRAGTRRFHLS